MQQHSAERVRREIIVLCHAGLDSRTLRIEIIKQLRKVIPIDVFFFSMVDPATLLFKREGEILQSVVRGLSTSEIANTFHITSHTVQDHLKAIFEKVGVRSRRELVGQLFAQQYQPRIAAGSGLDTAGWFTQAVTSDQPVRLA